MIVLYILNNITEDINHVKQSPTLKINESILKYEFSRIFPILKKKYLNAPYARKTSYYVINNSVLLQILLSNLFCIFFRNAFIIGTLRS